MNSQNVSQQDMILGGVATLLAINLIALPWLSITIGPFSFDFTATSTPDGWLGILALMATLTLIADLVTERYSPSTELPTIGDSRETTRFALACVTTMLLLLKFLLNIHFGLFGFGFYAAVILTASLLWAANQARLTHTSLADQW